MKRAALLEEVNSLLDSGLVDTNEVARTMGVSRDSITLATRRAARAGDDLGIYIRERLELGDPMARPREAHVQSETKICPEHGETEFRIHKKGFQANGTQRYISRCPACHTASVKSYAKAAG